MPRHERLSRTEFGELVVVHFSLLATRRSAAAVCAPAVCSLTA